MKIEATVVDMTCGELADMLATWQRAGADRDSPVTVSVGRGKRSGHVTLSVVLDGDARPREDIRETIEANDNFKAGRWSAIGGWESGIEVSAETEANAS